MEKNGNRRGCGFDELIVSYIYDEVTTGERRQLEGHLVECSACTDEFASISNARFSVFEWHKEDFSELPTPEIVIPYPARHSADQETGIIAGIRALLGGFAMPVAVAAGLLLTVGLAFVAFTISGSSDDHLAANFENEIVKPVAVPEKPAVEHVPTVPPTVPAPRPVEVVKDVADGLKETRTVKAVEAKRQKPSRQLNAQTAERVPGNQQPRKAPALSNFDEDDDRSLRLTDLFADEIGTRR